MKPSDADKCLTSMRDILRRVPDEKLDKKYIATFEGIHKDKQLALWRTLKDTTRLKLENFSADIEGVVFVDCPKNADLRGRLRDGRGVCVEVNNESALIELVNSYFEKTKADLTQKTAENAPSPTSESSEESSSMSLTYKDFGEAPDDNAAELNEFARKVRAGQRAFRANMIELYDCKCAITGEAIEGVLEAAHIIDHAESGINHSDNGILLRADLHLLFDKSQLKINPDTFVMEIDSNLKGSSYWVFNGVQLRKRKNGSQPSKEYLLRKWYEKV